MAPFRFIDRVQPGRGFAIRYFGVVALLALALGSTVLLRTWQASRAEDHFDELRQERVREALAYIQRDFTSMQRDLLDVARRIARDEVVVAALRSHARGQRSITETAALLGPRLVDHGSVEVYDVMPRLVGWSGHAVPLDDAPSRRQFLESSQISIALDEHWHTALVAWWPVYDGRRPLGAVRAMEPLVTRVPIENEFLREESIARNWRYAINRPVEVSFGSTAIRPGDLRPHEHVLQGIDGTPLGVVSILPPTDAEVRVEIGRRYDDVAAFWATLLLFWLLAGLFYLYRRAPGRFEVLTSFVALAVALWGVRGALLTLDVPARWQTDKAPLAPLFDPTRLASTAGFGTLQSTGDVFITGVFALLFAVLVLHLLHEHAQTNRAPGGMIWRNPGVAGLSLAGLFVSTATVYCGGFLAAIVRRVVLDSTLDYYARSGIIPNQSEWLVVVVFAALLLFMLALAMLGTALMGWWIRCVATYRGNAVSPQIAATVVGIAVVAPVVLAYLFFDFERLVPWPAAIAFLIVVSACGFMFFLRSGQAYRLLTLRGVLMAVFILAVLLYPTYYNAIDTKRRIQMVDAAESFDEGRDPRILFGLEQVLDQMSGHDRVARLLDDADPESRAEIDSIASHYLNSSLLGSLGPYDVSVTVLDANGRVAGRNLASDPLFARLTVDQIDSTEFDILRAMYQVADREGPLIDRITGRIELDRMQYVGIAPVARRADTLGWVMARVEPQTLFQFVDMPYPRVLLPQGFFELIHANVSLAEFQNGVLARSLGRDFGRYRLGDEVQSKMATQSAIWTREAVEERTYLTYYTRKQPDLAEDAPGATLRATTPGVIAVRVAATNTFDHLYYLLRLTVAGLLLGIPLHLMGVYLRWQAGLLPAERVPFREKVLNAFLLVGIISVAAVGFVGGEVVEDGAEASVRSSLRQHLERVEQTLVLEGRGSELPYRTLDRIGIDSLAARAGLDLNLYSGWELAGSSRPEFVRDRLLDERLPIDVFRTLYHEGHRFTTATEHIGSFEYKAGYRTLLDEQGAPQYVVAVPILPEQERIEEDQARTIAYLFGALLILVIVVMFTASILADALARPIGRLRAGLEAVARGRFERSIPVQTRDEIGELVETFNVMQEQLAESRRKLAQQERQLAWREMARQVAHEIKNPLTPMKLSVQHLRRAYADLDGSNAGEVAPKGKFASMFDRVTQTLIEQIDTLARIADEFSSFAKLPTRVREELDLNAVIEQAVDLMREEQAAEVELDLSEESIVVMADREELRRVYINLIKNAFQSMPEGREGVVVVTSRIEQSDSGARWAWSTVADNGSGIPQDVREKIFEPNFSTKTSGMGLGLAIVRKSVEAMEGEIGFDTEEGEGTTFWIRLPLAEE